VLPVFKKLYASVKSGKETRRVIQSCGKKNYKELLDGELAQMGNSEMWRAGKAVRSLRPRQKAKAVTRSTKGVAGRRSN
jgi:ketol-acid reductoisomerase